MCGRFALDATQEMLLNQFSLRQSFQMKSRFNIAPSTIIPIIRGTPRKLDFVRWGFIPSWARSDEQEPKGHINARSETVHEKPSFKAAFKTQRCLIPASGYFEWKTIHGKKQPFYIRLKETPLMAFGGLWSSWVDANHETVETAAILTVPAIGELIKIHDRMPFICDEKDYDLWLDAHANLEEVQKMFEPKLLHYQFGPVSPRVNNPRFDDPVCIQSLS